MPLLEALDPDIGVGFDDEAAAAPLLADLRAGERGRRERWSRREEHLLARVLELQAGGRHELVLDARDLERIEQAGPGAAPGRLRRDGGRRRLGGRSRSRPLPRSRDRSGRPVGRAAARPLLPRRRRAARGRRGAPARRGGARSRRRVRRDRAPAARPRRATWSRGRCSASTSSPASGARERRRTGSSDWTTCSSPSRVTGSCSGRAGSGAAWYRG